MTYQEASKLAHQAIRYLDPVTEKISIVGSTRRLSKMPGSVDLLMIPHHHPTKKGMHSTKFATAVFMMGHIHKGTPANFKELKLTSKTGHTMNLYTCTEDNWNWMRMIRTGHHDYTKKLLGRLKEKGIISDKGYPKDSATRELVIFNTEQAIWKKAGVIYTAPDKRYHTNFKMQR